ncbi:hypothetical protein CDEST_11057 [Colletotrichum destructivum]|uniref:Uncharacterized protein n=1 Tax=Colletotrichum destructivum TaxID=34406 RepID=A0AAX4IS84_9PEZI|nr:hypothetical protein CDEST_11057 [Colletotrichum destructivum]
MKIPTMSSLILVSALLLHGVAMAWQRPSFRTPLVSSWLGDASSPGMPQFGLDMEYPWLCATPAHYPETDAPAADPFHSMEICDSGCGRPGANCTAIIEERRDMEELGVGSNLFRSSGEEQQLRELTGLLAAFPNLRRLHLPRSAELDLGFDGGHLWCGNAYFDEDGLSPWLEVQAEDMAATRRAGEIVRDALPGLKGLYVRCDEGGEQYGNFTADAEGNEFVDWTWVGDLAYAAQVMG